MKKFIGIRAKTYSYLIGDGSEDKKVKGTKENLSLKIIKNFQKLINLKIKYTTQKKMKLMQS